MTRSRTSSGSSSSGDGGRNRRRSGAGRDDSKRTNSGSRSWNRPGARSGAGGIATIALMSALALIFSYVEAIIPYSPGVPGIKLGIANIVTVIALYRLSAKHAAGVNAIRIVVAGLLFNGVFAMLYSLAGAALSLTGMILAKRTGLFSTSGVSMIGGVLHNLGQIIVAAILIDDIRMFYYFPVLIISGLICGVVIGVVAQIVIDRLDRAAL